MSKSFRDAGNVQGYPELSADQTTALRFFRQNHGRLWKHKLRESWRQDRVRVGLDVVVYALRNTHGPAWLSKMQLKVT